ncbi:primosomal protein N' [Brevibacillus dissolubilis]|uniref:primosomal protein N' n=1 Tax=Brevibacillus dissolubilis TaxID=1844116 RepID=UPI00111691E4|nr:primosomal protein N' [Brevibacillus dissolubilis]
MIAKVIVDVPTNRTNRPFDYLVPDWLAPLIQEGSRVVVPFGPRKLQGYVVELIGHASANPSTATSADPTDEPATYGLGLFADEDLPEPAATKLKEVLSVLDDEPPLTTELIRMGEWMGRQYLCPWTMALTAMLPAVLKGKAEKWLVATESLTPELASTYGMLRYVADHGAIQMGEAEKRFSEEFMLVPGWIKAGWIATEYQVKDRITRKKVAHVSLTLPREEVQQIVEDLPPRSERMKHVLLLLVRKTEPVPIADVMELLNITRSTINTMEKKGWVKTEQIEVYRDPYADRKFPTPQKYQPTPEQARALAAILPPIYEDRFASFLLHGVTGSGKTEVYMEAIEQTLAKGKEAIFLVPEISLTPQMVERFKGRFGDNVAVIHSALSQGERYDEWRKILRRQVQVVVGARSAIFAPFRNLGLIIIDEEHESTYKQEETPRYHARDVATWRAKANDAVLILGSATPALETYALATRGRYELLTMAERVGNRPLPKIHIVDMRDELRDKNVSMFSRRLHEMIQDRLQKKEQIVLFLNRRGFSTFVMCRECGHTLRCPHCDISLTYHRTNNTVRCHYCSYTIPQPNNCPECQSQHIRFFGTGTQRVEEELAKLFPGVRVIRMDVDTTSKKGAHEQLLTQFRNGQADILLGTQMIAKGLDFPRITLVGVIAADTSLNLPDFRAAEKTFQLLTQVAGRAGRHELKGEVVVQTYSPEHYSIVHATEHDYVGFYQREMVMRKERQYPPFYRLVLITFSHEDVPVLMRAAENFAGYLRPRLAPTTQLIGPCPSPIARIKDRFRFQIMLKYRDEPKITDLLAQTSAQFDDWMKSQKVTLTIDPDPQMLL